MDRVEEVSFVEGMAGQTVSMQAQDRAWWWQRGRKPRGAVYVLVR
jgi:hypothetical protein